MNEFSDLTDEQVFKLTPDQVEFYVNLECAKNGVLLLPDEKPVEPRLEKPLFDAVAFEVGSFKVETSAEASIILAALKSVKIINLDYESATGYDSKVIRRLDSYTPDVKQIACYSPETFSAAKKQIAEYNMAKNAYDRARKEYDDIVEKREKAASWIWERVDEVKEKHNSRERLVKEYQRYLTLANGDTAIALNFLQNAYKMEDGEIKQFATTIQNFVD